MLLKGSEISIHQKYVYFLVGESVTYLKLNINRVAITKTYLSLILPRDCEVISHETLRKVDH